MTRPRRSGATLVELLVVLALLAVLVAVQGLGGAPSGRSHVPEETETLRRRAVSIGRDSTSLVMIAGEPALVTATASGELFVYFAASSVAERSR